MFAFASFPDVGDEGGEILRDLLRLNKRDKAGKDNQEEGGGVSSHHCGCCQIKFQSE